MISTVNKKILRLLCATFISAALVMACNSNSHIGSSGKILSKQLVSDTSKSAGEKWLCTYHWLTGNPSDTKARSMFITFLQNGSLLAYNFGAEHSYDEIAEILNDPRSNSAQLFTDPNAEYRGSWSRSGNEISWKFEGGTTSYSGQISGETISGVMNSSKSKGLWQGKKISGRKFKL